MDVVTVLKKIKDVGLELELLQSPDPEVRIERVKKRFPETCCWEKKSFTELFLLITRDFIDVRR